MSELRFATQAEALQYLADKTGKRIKIAGFFSEGDLEQMNLEHEQSMNDGYKDEEEEDERWDVAAKRYFKDLVKDVSQRKRSDGAWEVVYELKNGYTVITKMDKDYNSYNSEVTVLEDNKPQNIPGVTDVKVGPNIRDLRKMLEKVSELNEGDDPDSWGND